MKAPGSKAPATQITTRATHISSRLSTLAHSWVTDSQGILLTCLFNFTEPHNSCCHHTCKPRTSKSSKACEPGCVHFHSAAQMCPVIIHGDEQILVVHLSADKVKRSLWGCLPNITAIDPFTCDLSQLSCFPRSPFNQTLEAVKVSCHWPNVVLFMTLPAW